MTDEGGPWTEHDGKGCPCVGSYVHVLRRAGRDAFGVAGEDCRNWGVDPHSKGSAWVWSNDIMSFSEVIRYRIRRPRALLDLIERARELDDAPEGPVRVKPMVKEDAQ